jgi:hypothetical protein
MAVALQLLLEGFEYLALKLGDPPAAQACHVDVGLLPHLAFVEVALAVQVHQVQLVNHALPL